MLHCVWLWFLLLCSSFNVLEMDKCLLCGESLDVASKPTNEVQRGIDALRNASKLRGDTAVFEKLVGIRCVKVHSECRKNYTRPSSLKAYSVSEQEIVPQCSSRLVRSDTDHGFDIKTHCLFCGNDPSFRASTKIPTKYRKVMHEVLTLSKKESIEKQALARNDKWGQLVLSRIATVGDLVAAGVKYCHDCHLRFFTSKKTDHTKGQGEISLKHEAFLKLCSYMESSEECQFSINELMCKMKELIDDEECYSEKHLLRKLDAHYGRQISISTLNGQNSIISFSGTAKKILVDSWYESRNKSEVDERRRIVETAARIVREDVRKMVYDTTTYPSSADLSVKSMMHLIPETLQCFLDIIIQSKSEDKSNVEVKRMSIAQALISACRPRSFLSPILNCLGMYIHRKHASKQLIELLNSVGFSSSYNEVQRYEYSLMEQSEPCHRSGEFIQFIFDNADFNVRTLNGHGTFHAMGGVKCTTPAPVPVSIPVPRIKKVPSAAEIAAKGEFPLQWYKKPIIPGLKSIIIEDVTSSLFQSNPDVTTQKSLDLLWLSSIFIPAPLSPKPHWNGFMETLYESSESGSISKIDAVPFINLDPSNLTTIYTALKFAANQCREQGQTACFVTFDQPLYAKAVEIVTACGSSSDLSNVIVRLGGFHLIMSYLGSIGHVMLGSGLEDAWGEVYAKASVTHMISGHAYARSVRAHFLTQTAIGILLLKDIPEIDGSLSNEIAVLVNCMQSKNLTPGQAATADAAVKLGKLLDDKCNDLSSSRTCKLWIQYFHLVSVLRLFIKAERTGNWNLHLHCVKKMLPLFHAAGHMSYARYAHLYIQQMENLHTKLPAEEFKKFTEQGFFTIRRTEKFWSGVWTDLVIEQDLMRVLKSSGGLTRGRGLNDCSLAKFVLAQPQCWNVCTALEKIVGTFSGTSEQHVELRASRKGKDHADLLKILKWFEVHPPFDRSDNLLVSLSTGVVADDTVNCDSAMEVGLEGVREIVGNNFHDVTIKRKNKVVPLSAMSGTIKIRGEEVLVNPQQLFMRISCILKCPSDYKEYISFELAPKPPSLFDGHSMRKTPKSALAETLSAIVPCTNVTPVNSYFVVDGGYLLHQVVWSRPSTYEQICNSYVSYVTSHFGVNRSELVFDGYDGPPTTKNAEQSRRGNRFKAADAVFDLHSIATAKQADFLANSNNKSRLIAALMHKMDQAGIKTRQAAADADTLIVSVAMEKASQGETVVVVGTDTDLLALLVSRCDPSHSMYFLKTGTGISKIWNIIDLQQKLGDMKDVILFLHASTGCDTTSALYKKGKRTAWKLLSTSEDLRNKVKIFNMPGAIRSDLEAAGENFLLHLYGDRRCKTLNELRYFTLHKKVARQKVSASFDLASLPPTSEASSLHFLRVYLQVQQWLGNQLPPTEWGWCLLQGNLLPIPSNRPPAPEHLLQLITCNCKNNCSKKCDCRLAGLACSTMCSHCRGIDCMNSPRPFITEESEDDEG